MMCFGSASVMMIRRSIFTSLSLFHKKLPQELTLLDTYNINKYWSDDWKCTSDKGFGGPSIAELSIEEEKSNDEYIKYLRFQGSMNMTQQKAKMLGVAGGFCAFRGEITCNGTLEDYQGFEIICKSGIDTNIILNMTLENRTEEDVYQVYSAHSYF